MSLLAPDDFGAWLRAKRLRRLLPEFGVLVTMVSSVVTMLPDALAWKWLTLVLLAAQLVTVLVLFLLIKQPLLDATSSPRATIAVTQFAQTWRRLWGFWCLLFIGLCVDEVLRQASPAFIDLNPNWPKAIATVTLNTLSNLSTSALFICYFIASERTVIVSANDAPRPGELHWDRAIVLVILFVVLDLMIQANEIQGWHLLPWPNATAIPQWITGVASGLAIALFVGRLDSKFLNLPLLVMVPLYMYAVIQPAWPSFANIALKTILLSLALGLKCLMWAVIYWMFESGVFLYYIERINEVQERATPDRRAYLERVQRSLTAVPRKTEPTQSDGPTTA